MRNTRGRRVLVYSAVLLFAPMPAMPFAVGTREFAMALVATSAVLIVGSGYVVRGELGASARPLLGQKLLALSGITLAFGVVMLLGAVIVLVRR